MCVCVCVCLLQAALDCKALKQSRQVYNALRGYHSNADATQDDSRAQSGTVFLATGGGAGVFPVLAPEPRSDAVVEAPELKAFLDAVKLRDKAKVQGADKKCLDAVEACLSSKGVRLDNKQLCAVTDVLLRRAGQHAHLFLFPDRKVDLLPFLKRSMAGVYDILCAMGQKRHAQSPAAAQVVGLYMIVGPHMRRVLPGARW
jgi:hypothetical protein